MDIQYGYIRRLMTWLTTLVSVKKLSISDKIAAKRKKWTYQAYKVDLLG